jgi:hypothetical protein
MTTVRPGHRDITVYVGLRPFEGEWIEKNEAVLAGLAWQGVEGLKVKFVCWPSESSTAVYAAGHGYEALVVPWYRQYLFPGPQRSFKAMFETALMDCDTEIFVYINGDIVLGPGVLGWIQEHVEHSTLYSLPRHNWDYDGPLRSPADFERALERAVPEEWTAVDLFALRATEGRQQLIPLPPFLLTAGSMDSWLVARTGELGWRRVLVPPDSFRMLHVEHPFSHPLKPGAAPEKVAKWAFNCGIYETATQGMDVRWRMDTSLAVFEGAERYKFKNGLPSRAYTACEDIYECGERTFACGAGEDAACVEQSGACRVVRECGPEQGGKNAGEDGHD